MLCSFWKIMYTQTVLVLLLGRNKEEKVGGEGTTVASICTILCQVLGRSGWKTENRVVALQELQ